MERKVHYLSDEHRTQLIADAEAAGERLIEDAITVTEGNYLIFTDEQPNEASA